MSAATASSAVAFAASVANASRALRSISPDARSSLVSALSSTINAGFLGGQTRHRRRLSSAVDPADEITDVLSAIHLLTLADLYPGEEAVTTSAGALALRSLLAQCTSGACDSMRMTSPILLGEEETNVAEAAFVLSGSTLEEMSSLTPSRCSTTDGKLGLLTIRWQHDPHQHQTAAVLNVSSLSATRCGGELAVQNLSSPIRITLPAAAPQNGASAVEENFTAACSRAGDQAVITYEDSDIRFNATCLQSLRWNVSCGIRVALPQCLWYDSASQTWLADGCHSINLTTSDGATTVSCECSHLTDFAGRISTQVAGGFSIVEVLTTVDTESLRQSWAILTLIVGSYICAIGLFWCDTRFLKRQSNLQKQYIYDSPKCQDSLEWLATFSMSLSSGPRGSLDLNQNAEPPNDQWMRNAVERAQQIETSILSSRRRLQARLAPRLDWTLQDFRDEMCREHIFGAIISPSRASLDRAAVVLVRLIAFLYADAIAYSVFTDDDEVDYRSLTAGRILSLMIQLETVLLKTVIVVICIKPFKSILLMAMNHVEERERTFALIERKLAVDGLPRIISVGSVTSLVRSALAVCDEQNLSMIACSSRVPSVG